MKDLRNFIKTTIRGYLNEQKMINEQYYFDYNCVSPRDYDELEYIIDNMKEISADLFLRNVSLDEINSSLMYGIRYNSKEKVKSDWGLSFYRLKKGNIDAFILINSSIEYVFKKA